MPCYPDDTKGVRGDAVDSIITRIRSGRSKFRDLVPLLASKGLPLGAKDRLYSDMYLALCYMKVRLGLLNRKMLSDWRGMTQE